MKKIFTIYIIAIISFTFNLLNLNAQCTYQVKLYDSYGDGWNGSTIDIKTGSTTINYTLDNGSDTTINLAVMTSDSIVLNFLGGGLYTSEVSFELIDPNYMVIYSSGTSPSIGYHYANTALCPSCLPVNSLSITNMTSTSVDLNWTSSSPAIEWQIEYGTNGFAQGNGTTINVNTAPPYNLSGLASGSSYDWYVRSICAVGDTSVWSTVGSFSTCPSGTVCGVYTAGDIATEYGLNTVADFPSSCPGTITLIIPAGNRIDSIATSYDMTAGNGAWMSEQASMLYSPSTLTGEATITDGSGSSAGTYSYSRSGLTFANGATDTVLVEMHAGRSYGGTGCDPSYNKVDNGTWSVIAYYGLIPTCIEPSVLSVSNDLNALGTSVLFSWTENGSATEWQIEYGTSGFTQGTGISSIVNNDTTNITGLNATTTYDFYVRSICAPGDTSAWTGPINFMTSCLAYTAPFLENFDTLPLISPYTMLPSCWEVQTGSDYWSVTNDVINNGHTYLPNIGDHTTGSSNYMWIDASSDILANEMVTPFIDMSGLTTPMAGFWFASNNTTNNINHTIALDAWDGSAWVNIVTKVGNFPDWVEVSGIVPSSIPSVTKFRIYAIANPSSTSSNYYQNDLGVDDFFVMETPVNEIQLSNIITASPLCAGSQNIALELVNLGGNTVDSVEIYYSINTFAGTYKYTTAINSGDTAIVPLGAYPFAADTVYDVQIYTFNPNGTTDSNPLNDTIYIFGFRTGLNGAYTINSTAPTYGSNFNTITEFSDALKMFGMCGTVVANLTPGVHSGQMDIIDNAFPVIINGSDTSLATLTHDGSIRNATIFLQNASDVTILGTTIEATGGTDSWGIQLFENVNNVVIANNRFKLSVASTSDKAGISISGSETSNSTMASNISDITIASNSFYGGYTGVNAYGGSAQNQRLLNLLIAGNTFDMQYYYGIYAFYTDSLMIAGNTIGNLQTSLSDGIYLSDLENFTITGNHSAGLDNGLYITDANTEYAVSSNAVISNNMFIGGDDGIYVSDMHKTNVFHNSTFGEDYGIYLNDPDSLDIRNNIFLGNSSSAFYSLDSAYMVLDYNIYHTNGTNDLIRFGGTSDVYADLAAFQAAVPTLNMNSLQGDPWYISNLDLHVIGSLANDVGDNSVGITVDFDGDPRPLSPSTTVDIGADEFTLASCLQPTNLVVLSVTANTAELSWTENGSATQWQIEYDTANYTQGTGTVISVINDTAMITGLTPLKDYEFYVRSICSQGDSSIWAGPFQFTSGCPVFVAPFIEDFQNGGSIPTCWAQGSNNSEDWKFDNSVGSNHIGNNGNISTTSLSGGYFAWVDDSSPHSSGTTLETPLIDVSGLTNPILKFYMISHNEGNSNVDFSVEVWTGTSWDSVYFSNSNTLNGEWEEFEIPIYLLNITGPIQVRFIVDENNGTDFYDDLAIDDVSIVNGPSCLPPNNLTVNTKATSATVYWNEVNAATEWQVEYGNGGFTQGLGNISITNVDSMNITGLAEGEYDFYLRSICAPGDTSEWTMVSFEIGYCDITFSMDIEPITMVDFAGISNASSAVINATPYYQNFTSIVGTVEQGGTYPISLEGNTGGAYMNHFTVYIDWNQDGDFDEPNEEYYIDSLISSTGLDGLKATSNILVPTNALLGNTRMRVTKRYDVIADPCNAVGFGQAEDYTLNVIEPIIPYYAIGDLRAIDSNGVADSLNVYAWTSGTVAGVDLDGTPGLSFTVIDQSGSNPAGIHVASATAVSGYTVNEGDSINIRGTVNQINGLLTLEVDSIEFIQANSSLPAHQLVTVLDETTESQLVQIENMEVISVGTGTDFEVELSNGTDTLTMWVDADTDVDNIIFSTGQNICTVFGIGSQDDPTSPFLEGYRIVPMFASDVIFNPSVNLGMDTIVCDTGNFILDAGAGFASYSWNTGDSTQTITPTDANDSLYIVTVTTANGCSATDTIIVEVDICTGIQENNSNSSFTIAPNPSNGMFNISAKGLKNGKGNIVIRDISGKAILSEDVDIVSGSLDLEINIQEFAKGIYFMNFNNGSQNISKKIVVQ